MFKRAVLIAVIALLSACASNPKPACGVPGGTTCMSAKEVYFATENTDRVTGYGAAYGNKRTKTETHPHTPPSTGTMGVMLEGQSLTLTDAGPAPIYPTEDSPAAVPVRAPAKVMRIWIAPFEDDAGDLVVAGHVFTEIQARRWTVGKHSPSKMSVLLPLQVRNSTEPANAPAPVAAPIPASTSVAPTNH